MITCPVETSLGPIIISRGSGGTCTKPFLCSRSMVPSLAMHRPRATTALTNWPTPVSYTHLRAHET
eukprot:3650556-Lingulodinium_polyedra.AAC.1